MVKMYATNNLRANALDISPPFISRRLRRAVKACGLCGE
jgi:hypothetical protein